MVLNLRIIQKCHSLQYNNKNTTIFQFIIVLRYAEIGSFLSK